LLKKGYVGIQGLNFSKNVPSVNIAGSALDPNPIDQKRCESARAAVGEAPFPPSWPNRQPARQSPRPGPSLDRDDSF
jgi:hypothetical protein